jgi:sn-glycerol 3-phosphate transport system substrate-binding protein
MKKLVSVLAVLMMVLSLIPAALAEAPVEIVFWHSMGGVNGEAVTAMVDSFNKANEGKIKVNVEYQGSYDDAINKIKAASMSALPCDVVQIYDIGSRFMIDSGWVKPVQDFIDANSYDISQIEPNIAAYYTIDGKLYSMPFNSSPPSCITTRPPLKKPAWIPTRPPRTSTRSLPWLKS